MLIQSASGGDSTPRIYFHGPVRSRLDSLLGCSILGEGLHQAQRRAPADPAPSQPPRDLSGVPPLERAGWLHGWHEDRPVWRGLGHHTEQLWRSSTSGSPGVAYFNAHVGFSELFRCYKPCCSTLARHAGRRPSGWTFTHRRVSKQLRGCSTCPWPRPALTQQETRRTRQSFPFPRLETMLLACRQVTPQGKCQKKELLLLDRLEDALGESTVGR